MPTQRDYTALWWDLIPQGQYGIQLGRLPWEQLSPAAQAAVSAYYNGELVPTMLGKPQTRYDGAQAYDSPSSDGGSQNGNALVYQNNEALAQTLALNPMGISRDPTNGSVITGREAQLPGYTARDVLPQISLLYAIAPEEATAMGITPEIAMTAAQQFGEIHNNAQEASDSANATEGWLMALGAIGGGVYGAYSNGTLFGSGAQAGLTPAQQQALMGGLGETAGGAAAAPITYDPIAAQLAQETGMTYAEAQAAVAQGATSAAPGGAGSLAEYFGVPQASFAGPAGSTPIMSSNGVSGYLSAAGEVLPASGFGAQAAGLGGAAALPAVSGGGGGAPAPGGPPPGGSSGSVTIPGTNIQVPYSALATGLGALAGAVGNSNLPDTLTSSVAPWAPAQPYMLDVMNQAQTLYNNSGWTPEMQATVDSYLSRVDSQGANRTALDSVVSRLANMNYTPTQAHAGSATASQASIRNSMESMGSANPTAALSDLLAGRVDNPYLESMYRGVVNEANRNYTDLSRGLTTQLQESILPSIGLGARGAGSYGSSRQGIAEGNSIGKYLQTLATNQRDLTLGAYDRGASLFGTAYEAAQGRKSSTANNLAGLATQTANANAALETNAAIANAGNYTNVSISNANRDLQGQQLNINSNLSAIDRYIALQNSDFNTFNGTLAAQQAPYNYNAGVLGNYANVINMAGGRGSTTTAPNPNVSNLGSSILSGAGTGLALYNNFIRANQ